MYTNCNIINPINKHIYTFIMLHPMFCNTNYFDKFINYFSKFNIFKNIKFIFPESPYMNIDYPNNKLYNIKSWYNYYTCYDNISKIDNINIKEFEFQSKRIVNIINNEAIILNNFNNIFCTLF